MRPLQFRDQIPPQLQAPGPINGDPLLGMFKFRCVSA